MENNSLTSSNDGSTVMDGFTKLTGWVALLVGIMGFLAVITLALFFTGLFQDIPSLLPMGSFNDKINALVGILSAILASLLHPTLRRLMPWLSVMLLIGTWLGAIAITFWSWLIVTGRSDVELSSYYFFFGNGLIGTWLWMLNRRTRREAILPIRLTRLGLIAASFMMIGLLGAVGILLGLDGNNYSHLIMVTGISFFGTGIFYPIWCLLLGYSILSNGKTASSSQTNSSQLHP